MKILLINANPVVSRLLALCTRDTHLLLDEVSGVDEIKDVAYDLLFVDDGSYVDNIDPLLANGRLRKTVFIAYDKDTDKGFDEIIQKPFLPSQIIKVIESVDMSEAVDTAKENHFIFPLASEESSREKEGELSIFSPEAEDEKPEEVLEFPDEMLNEIENEDEESEFPEALPLEVLDSKEIEKIKALLEMDDEEIESVEDLSEEEVALRKVEVIKEQLISEGVEILDELEIVDVLSNKTKEKKALKCKKSKLKHKKDQKKKQNTLHCSKEELSQLESAMTQSLISLKPKQIKKFLKGKKIELKIKLEGND